MSKRRWRPKRLRDDVDIEALFLGNVGKEARDKGAEESFEALLDEYLTEAKEEGDGEALDLYTTRHKEYLCWRPQEILDLHGLTREEAILSLEFFIKRARHKGMACVRVITGKGLHSPGGPVLKDVIEKKVVDLKRGGEIKGFRWEKKKRSKSGAILIRL